MPIDPYQEADKLRPIYAHHSVEELSQMLAGDDGNLTDLQKMAMRQLLHAKQSASVAHQQDAKEEHRHRESQTINKWSALASVIAAVAAWVAFFVPQPLSDEAKHRLALFDERLSAIERANATAAPTLQPHPATPALDTPTVLVAPATPTPTPSAAATPAPN